jgi:hypothetical protein
MMFRSVVRVFIGVSFLLSAQFAMAQGAGQGPTPGQSLGQFRDGGPEMVKQIRDLVAADKASVATIISFARTANEDQRKAIAEGLAQVAKANAQNDPAFANSIQQAVAASGIPELAKAYAEAAGDTGTASTGGGGGGGGGGPNGPGAPSGGQNAGGTGPGSTFTTNGFSNNLTSQSLGGASFSQISQF